MSQTQALNGSRPAMPCVVLGEPDPSGYETVDWPDSARAENPPRSFRTSYEEEPLTSSFSFFERKRAWANSSAQNAR
jgi:hypothetical protein